VGQHPRRAVGPCREQLLVDVLRLDRAQAHPFPGVSARIRRSSPARGTRDRTWLPRPPLRPATVIGPDVDAGEHDLAMPRGQRAAHVREHHAWLEAPLRAAGPRDDAVRAVERAAVLDLDEGPGPLHRGPVVGDAVDAARGGADDASGIEPAPVALDGLDPDSVGSAASSGPCGWASGAPRRTSASSSRSRPALASLPTSRAEGSVAAKAAASTWTEQPVTTMSAAGFARRARRTAARDFSSAMDVTVQVLTRYRSAARSASSSGTPASRSSRAAASISDG